MPSFQSSINNIIGSFAAMAGLRKIGALADVGKQAATKYLNEPTQQQMEKAQAQQDLSELTEQANVDLESLGTTMAKRNYAQEPSAFGEARPYTRAEQVLANAYQAGLNAQGNLQATQTIQQAQQQSLKERADAIRYKGENQGFRDLLDREKMRIKLNSSAEKAIERQKEDKK